MAARWLGYACFLVLTLNACVAPPVPAVVRTSPSQQAPRIIPSAQPRLASAAPSAFPSAIVLLPSSEAPPTTPPVPAAVVNPPILLPVSSPTPSGVSRSSGGGGGSSIPDSPIIPQPTPTPVPLRWAQHLSLPAETSMTGGSPLAANGLIYQASGDGKLRGIDQGTGSQLWERALPDLIDSSPAIDSQNQLYLGTYHGLVLSLDLTPKKWRHENREFA